LLESHSIGEEELLLAVGDHLLLSIAAEEPLPVVENCHHERRVLAGGICCSSTRSRSLLALKRSSWWQFQRDANARLKRAPPTSRWTRQPGGWVRPA